MNFILYKKFINPGFVFGAFCPVYGFGGVAVAILLAPLAGNIFVVFGLGVLLASIIEHAGHWMLEKLYSLKLWDYSHRKLNLKGRICIVNSLIFGGLAVVVVYAIQPFLEIITSNLPSGFIIAAASAFSFWFIFDIVNNTFKTPEANKVIENKKCHSKRKI